MRSIQKTQAPLQGLPAVIQHDAVLAILGSFPGKASLQVQQYYAFARNHFWAIIGTLLGTPDLQQRAFAEKLHFLVQHRIALWDVYAACQREGSLDADIQAGEPNDLALLKQWAPGLKVIAHNGGASAKFKKQTSLLGVQVVQLPSTSPANASWSFERKLAAWRQVFVQAGILSENK